MMFCFSTENTGGESDQKTVKQVTDWESLAYKILNGSEVQVCDL